MTISRVTVVGNNEQHKDQPAHYPCMIISSDPGSVHLTADLAPFAGKRGCLLLNRLFYSTEAREVVRHVWHFIVNSLLECCADARGCQFAARCAIRGKLNFYHKPNGNGRYLTFILHRLVF